MWSSTSTSGYAPQIINSRVLKRYLHTHMHSGKIHNSQEVKANHMCTDGGWIHKMCHITIQQNTSCSALDRKAILTQATLQMNPEDLTVNEIRQSQQDKCCMTPFTWSMWSSQIHGDSTWIGAVMTTASLDLSCPDGVFVSLLYSYFKPSINPAFILTTLKTALNTNRMPPRPQCSSEPFSYGSLPLLKLSSLPSMEASASGLPRTSSVPTAVHLSLAI